MFISEISTLWIASNEEDKASVNVLLWKKSTQAVYKYESKDIKSLIFHPLKDR
jgi:hypothetical protein